MPYTPEQIAKIRKKLAETPDALKRDPLSDYTEGWFHVTLNVRDEAPVLGFVVGDVEAPDGCPNAPRCELTELGRRVEHVWKTVDAFHPMCKCDEMQVMPEHIHVLLHLLPGNSEHLGRIINGLMIGSTHCYWDMLGIRWQAMRSAKDTAAFTKERDKMLRAQWQDPDHTRSFRGPSLFVRGYNDVEAIGEEEVEIKRQYIRNNPRKHLIKRDKPDRFRVNRSMKSANWTPERIMLGLCADRFIAADRSKQVEAWQQLTTKGLRNNRGKVSATLKFISFDTSGCSGSDPRSHEASNLSGSDPRSHEGSKPFGSEPSSCETCAATSVTPSLRPVLDLVGNLELLNRPLFPLVCHRADAHLFEQQKAAVLKVAREQNGVIVTACVSPRERDIVKLLQQELLPVIVVMDNGFGDRYKPTGKAFYAVAEGRRLEVTPWEYEYRRRELQPVKDAQGNPVLDANGKPEMEEVSDITREMCMVMNELVRIISCVADDWWKGLV